MSLVAHSCFADTTNSMPTEVDYAACALYPYERLYNLSDPDQVCAHEIIDRVAKRADLTADEIFDFIVRNVPAAAEGCSKAGLLWYARIAIDDMSGVRASSIRGRGIFDV